ncbi:MAG: PAS domain S-box protein, partial [Anaerolineae bacterium]|nr:PAS domain S-box protein [Anaerolineae bacterium]
MVKGYTALNHFILERVTPVVSGEERRRIYIVILLTGFHLALASVEALQSLLLVGKLDIPDVAQLVLNTVVIVLIWKLHLKAGIWFLIFSYITAILSVFYNADLNDLVHATPTFVSIIVLVEWRRRILFAFSMFSFTLFVSWVTNDSLRLAALTPQSTLMFAALGMLSVVILTRISDGDLKQIREQISSLHENEQRYRILAENTTDLIGLHTLDGKFLYISPSITAQTGYTTEDLLSIPVEMLALLVHPDDL